jgi:LCP family protein required for cell wall assembly
VNLLLHVPADHQSATIMSFPRDLMVPIPSCPGPNGEPEYYASMSEQQLNSAMMYGGLPCVADTISELTGIDIPYAAVVTFDGVINISNAIGGVEVCLAQEIYDPKADLDLPAGVVSLQGYEALQFLRTRHGVGDGSDVSRISNQQVFMSALLRELQSAETLTNPVKVYGLAKAGFESLTLSSSMASIEFMQALAGTVVDIDLSRVNFVQYPSNSHPYQEGRLTPNRWAGDELISVVLSGQPFEIAGTGRGVAVPDEPEAPIDGETGVEGETGGESEVTEPTGEPGVIVLPESITGQSASDETCSAGRTEW